MTLTCGCDVTTTAPARITSACEQHGRIGLRDHFAGHALAGLAAYVDLDSRHPEVAALAYELADAMLKARDE